MSVDFLIYSNSKQLWEQKYFYIEKIFHCLCNPHQIILLKIRVQTIIRQVITLLKLSAKERNNECHSLQVNNNLLIIDVEVNIHIFS